VSTALGLLGILVFVPCVIGFAAGITWLVVRLSPKRTPSTPPADTA
jgi:hypothetical protein